MSYFPYAGLAVEYAALWTAMKINPHKEDDVDAAARMVIRSKTRYQKVEEQTGVPWYVIGIIHKMEANCAFSCHLHNGDSLKARTRQVPAGRPATGKPPFTWEASAVDALEMKNLGEVQDWSVERIAYELERYNGGGYRRYHPETLSPYLWSYTCHYRCGKYVADGRWSATAISSQSGAMAILQRLCELEGITVHSDFDKSDAERDPTIEEVPPAPDPEPITEFPKTPEEPVVDIVPAPAPEPAPVAPPPAPPAVAAAPPPQAAPPRTPDPAAADERPGVAVAEAGGWNFTVLNTLIEQGSRTARSIKHGKDAALGLITGAPAAFTLNSKSGTFLIIAGLMLLIGLVVWFVCKRAEKFFVAAAKDNRYDPTKRAA